MYILYIYNYTFICNGDNHDDYDNDKKNEQCYSLLMIILGSAICININNQNDKNTSH